MIGWGDASGTAGKYAIYTNDGVLDSAAVEFESGNRIDYISLKRISDYNVVIAFQDDIDGDEGRFSVITGNELPLIQYRLLGYTPTDGNSIFVAKWGNDTYSGTTKNPKLTLTGAISACDATHQAIVIMDSGTYIEDSFEFTGDFLGLYAAIGERPIFKPTDSKNTGDFTKTSNLISETFEEVDGLNNNIFTPILLENDNFVIPYRVDVNGKFVIYDEDGELVKSATTFDAGTPGYISGCKLNNGNFIIVYSDWGDSDKGKFVIFDEGGELIRAETEFESGHVDYTYCCLLNNTNFCIVYTDVDDGKKGKFVIYDEDGTRITDADPDQPVFEDGITLHPTVCLLKSTNFVIPYRDSGDGDKGKFTIYDEDGNQVKAPTEFESGATAYPMAVSLDNTNFLIAYCDVGDSGKGKFVIYDEDGTRITDADPDQPVFEDGAAYHLNICKLENSGVSISYHDGDDSDKGKFVIYDEDGNPLKSETEFSSNDIETTGILCLNNGNFMICFTDVTDSHKGKFVIWYPYSYSGLKISSASIINGIEIDANNYTQLEKIIEINSAKPTIKNCELKNCTNPANSNLGYAICGDNETDIHNSIIHDNGGGIWLGASVDNCIIKDNLIYWNDKDYAITIDGAAAAGDDISITHNDIFGNYAGIRLENNHGANETLDNNNIHGNSNDGVNADVEVTLNYTVLTDDVTNAASGTAVILANPLYLNEGAVTPGDLDLHIKTIVEGYFANSPAYLLADDGRNSGAYDVRYIGSRTTWSSMIIPKPLSMKPYLKPVDASKRIKKDGSVSSNKGGQTEYLPLQWQGIDKVYYDLILPFWCGDKNETRIYAQPTTSPDTYNIFYLLWDDDLPEYANFWKHSQDGVNDLKLLFARKFEPE